MSDALTGNLDDLLPHEMETIDGLCDHFERQWRNKASPRLEDYVSQAPEHLRQLLLQELLAIELPYRRMSGQAVSSEDYTSRFSELDIRQFRQINAKSIQASRHLATNSVFAAIEDPQSGNSMLGDFRLIREVGRGGMGVVFAAEQISLGRQVALKILPFSHRLSPRHLQRFQNEARAAASLQHPNIVPVYAVGCEKGVHYYAMQLIDGQTLAEKMVTSSTYAGKDVGHVTKLEPEQSPTSSAPANHIRTIVCQCIQAAEAIEHAHSMGIVHRDIKPGNLMLDQSGKLWVTDFGLARIGADANLTISGDLLGTLRFMSPEQALAKHGLVDHRTDVYSLGATLYELLAGRPAIEGKDRSEVLRKIAFEEPLALRRINPGVPRDLETIVHKSMAKEPQGRYQSAEELANDLRRFLHDRPILARRRTKVHDCARWMRRNRALSVVIGISAFLVLAANITTAWLWHSERKALYDVKQAQRLTLQHANELRKSVYLQQIARAEQELAHSSVGRAEQTLDRCEYDLRDWEWGYLKNACNAYESQFAKANARAYCVRYSPDGTRVACGYADGTIRIWDLTSKSFEEWKGHSVTVLNCVFDREGTRLATTAGDYLNKQFGEIRVWDLKDKSPHVTIDPQGTFVSSIDFSPDGKTLAIACWNKSIRLRNLTDGSEKQLLKHSSAVKAIRYSPDGRYLASGDRSGLVLLWNAAERKVVSQLKGHTHDVLDLKYDTTGTRLVSSSWDGSAILWNCLLGRRVRTFANSEILQRFGGGNNTVWSTAISPDGKTVATGSEDGAVRLWDASTGLLQALPRGHQGAVHGVDFSPDGSRLASVGVDGKLRIWNTNQKSNRATLPIQIGLYRQLTFRPDGAEFAVASGPLPVRQLPGQIMLLRAGEPARVISQRTTGFRSIAFDPDSRILAADFGTNVRVWDAVSGDYLRDLQGDAEITAVTATADQAIIAGNNDGKILQWSSATGEVQDSVDTTLSEVMCLATNKKGTILAAVGPEGHIVVSEKSSRGFWTPPVSINGTLLPNFEGAEPRAVLAFGPWKDTLAVGFATGTLELWNANKKQMLHRVQAHAGAIMSLSFSSNGLRLATGGADGTIALWDTESGQEALVLRKQLRNIGGVAFNPVDNTLAAIEELAEQVTLWNVRAEHDQVVPP
ncbi:MAG: protein kinase [Pirellulaceae bacterium]|nr:protein kinase [Pirellulaceae bacterium]